MWPFKKKEIKPKIGETRIEVITRNNGEVCYIPEVYKWHFIVMHSFGQWEMLDSMGAYKTLGHAQNAIDVYLLKQVKSVTYIKYP